MINSAMHSFYSNISKQSLTFRPEVPTLVSWSVIIERTILCVIHVRMCSLPDTEPTHSKVIGGACVWDAGDATGEIH